MDNNENIIQIYRKMLIIKCNAIHNIMMSGASDVSNTNNLCKQMINKMKNHNIMEKRIQKWEPIKYVYIMKKSSVCTIAFKASLDGISCIYAYLYAYSPSEFKFVCHGPTYRSQDGEYRSKFKQFSLDSSKGVYSVINNIYREYIEKIEASAIKKMQEDRLSFHVEFFLPEKKSHMLKDFKKIIDENRLTLKLFAYCWFNDYHKIYNNMMENHVNPAYMYIFGQKEDEHIYKELKKTIIDFYEKELQFNNNKCGQKIMPISVYGALRRGDINFEIWRELYILSLCSNLGLNLITFCVPMVGNWFYVHDSHGSLYDNLAMHEKYTKSVIGEEISEILKNSNRLTYKDNDTSKGPIDFNFIKLGRHIQKGIGHIDSHIRLTDYSVTFTMEHLGFPLRDIVLSADSHQYKIRYQILLNDINYFTHMVFQIVYALLSMNSKLNVMHSDLHMNNITLYDLFYFKDFEDKRINQIYTLYIMNNKGYIFKRWDIYPIIIDYSRAIISDYKKIVKDFGENYAILFFKDQRMRALKTIYHYFPKIVDKNRLKLESLLIDKFPLMFKIMTCLDVYMIIRSLWLVIKNKESDNYFEKHDLADHRKDIIDILHKVYISAERIFFRNMQDAINDKIKDPSDIPYPNEEIIDTCFEEFLLSEKHLDKKYKMAEIYNFNNEVKYDIEDYETWGPLLSQDEITRELNKRNIKNPNSHIIKKFHEINDLDEDISLDYLVRKYEDEEEETIEYESWMLM